VPQTRKINHLGLSWMAHRCLRSMQDRKTSVGHGLQ
jgi:hypothetical protein